MARSNKLTVCGLVACTSLYFVWFSLREYPFFAYENENTLRSFAKWKRDLLSARVSDKREASNVANIFYYLPS